MWHGFGRVPACSSVAVRGLSWPKMGFKDSNISIRGTILEQSFGDMCDRSSVQSMQSKRLEDQRINIKLIRSSVTLPSQISILIQIFRAVNQRDSGVMRDSSVCVCVCQYYVISTCELNLHFEKGTMRMLDQSTMKKAEREQRDAKIC